MKTLSRVFDSYAQARSAVEDLERAGVPSSDISIVANKHVSREHADVDEVPSAAKGAGIGAALGGTAGLLAGLGLLAIPGLGPVVAAGWFASTAAVAAAGAAGGGIVGALVDAGESKEHAHVYSEAVRRGGTLVTVRVADEDAGQMQAILDRHQPVDPVVRRSEYQREGWSTFDPAAPPYRPSDSEVERIRREKPQSTSNNIIAADKVEGTNVYNRVGDKLGTVDHVMIDKVDGQVCYAIMSFGGFLGMGESYHPLPWEKLDYDTSRGGFVVDIDKRQLEGAPYYKERHFGWTPDYGRRVDEYYGVGTRRL